MPFDIFDSFDVLDAAFSSDKFNVGTIFAVSLLFAVESISAECVRRLYLAVIKQRIVLHGIVRPGFAREPQVDWNTRNDIPVAHEALELDVAVDGFQWLGVTHDTGAEERAGCDDEYPKRIHAAGSPLVIGQGLARRFGKQELRVANCSLAETAFAIAEIKLPHADKCFRVPEGAHIG